MQTAPLSSALSRMVMSLLTDRGLYSWLSGSHYNLKLNTLKTVELIVDIMRNSPALPTHHHELHCGSSGVIQAPGQNLLLYQCSIQT